MEHTKAKLRVLSDGLTIKAIIDYEASYHAQPPQMLIAKCIQNGHLGRSTRPTKEDLANAKELVRRWNSHDDLLAALNKYGEHETGCMLGDACNCGLEAVLSQANA